MVHRKRRVVTPRHVCRSKYHILWTFTREISFMSQLRRTHPASCYEISSDYFTSWTDKNKEFDNSAGLISHVNHTLCVCLRFTFTCLTISDELDAHTETLRYTPRRVIIPSMTHVSRTPPMEYLCTLSRYALFTSNHTNHHVQQIWCLNAAQLCANVDTTPSIRKPVYFVQIYASHVHNVSWLSTHAPSLRTVSVAFE